VSTTTKTRDEMFWEKVQKTSTCWVWTASTSCGYGTFGIGNHRTTQAHRYSYESLVGRIPKGSQIDHICHNRRCVNPSHLRLASVQQNAQNHNGARSDSKSGVRGVSYCRDTGRWRADVAHSGKRWNLGRFATVAEAEAAAIAKRIELHTHNDLDRRA
jgi:hypothetical protein